jgi:hypothetical protein
MRTYTRSQEDCKATVKKALESLKFTGVSEVCSVSTVCACACVYASA